MRHQTATESLGRIVNAYLDLAEERARRRIPMTMEDWARQLDAFLQFTERDILQDSDKVSVEIAKAHAESEFEKYRIVQDRLFESDFDRVIKLIEAGRKSPAVTMSDTTPSPAHRTGMRCNRWLTTSIWQR